MAFTASKLHGKQYHMLHSNSLSSRNEALTLEETTDLWQVVRDLAEVMADRSGSGLSSRDLKGPGIHRRCLHLLVKGRKQSAMRAAEQSELSPQNCSIFIFVLEFCSKFWLNKGICDKNVVASAYIPLDFLPDAHILCPKMPLHPGI